MIVVQKVFPHVTMFDLLCSLVYKGVSWAVHC